MSIKNNVVRKDVLLLERILKGELKGHYGVSKSSIRIDLVIMCAEFDLEYHMLSQEAPAYKANRWYKKINGHIEEWPVEEYLQYLSENIRDKDNEKGANKDTGARSLATKVRYAIKVLRQILDGINFETGGQYTYRQNQKPNKDRREYVLKPLPAKGKGACKGFCAYSYRKSFSIDPYLALYLENIRKGVVVKTVQSAQYTITKKPGQIEKLNNDAIMRTMRTLTASLFNSAIDNSKDQYLSLQEIKDKIEIIRSLLRKTENQLETELVKDTLNSQLNRIKVMCIEKPLGWAHNSYKLFKQILHDYGQIDPTTHILLLVNFAKFLDHNRLNDEFRAQNINNEDWFDVISGIYEEAILISDGANAFEEKIDVIIDYAFFVQNNKKYDKLKNIYDTFFELYATEGEKYPSIYIPNLAWVLHAYGMVHYDNDNYQDAIDFLSWSRDLTKPLMMFDEVFSYYEIASSVFIADIQTQRREFNSASTTFCEIDEMYNKYSKHWSKSMHEIYAVALNKQGLLYKERGDLLNAKNKLQTAIETYNNIYNGDYVNCRHDTLNNISSLYCNIGNLCIELQDYALGKKMFCKSLSLLELLVGYNSELYEEELILTRLDYIELLCESCEWRTAINEIGKNITAYRSKYKENNIEIIKSLIRNYLRLAQLYIDTRQYESAINAYKDALVYLEQAKSIEPGSQLGALSITYMNMMAVYHDLEMPDKESEMLNNALSVLHDISEQTGMSINEVVEKLGAGCDV